MNDASNRSGTVAPDSSVPDSSSSGGGTGGPKRTRSSEQLERSKLMLLGIAHDLNNLLTIFAIELESLAAEQRDERTGRSLERLSETAVDASHYVRELIDVERGRKRHPGEHDLGALVESAMLVMRPLLDERYEVDVVRERDLPLVRIIPFEIKQALMNLLFNARKATPPGGAISVQIGRTTLAGNAADCAPRDAVYVAVRDTGVGVSPEARGEAQGLGLQIVERVIAENGGHFTLRRRVPKGSEAIVTFPSVESRTPKAQTPERR